MKHLIKAALALPSILSLVTLTICPVQAFNITFTGKETDSVDSSLTRWNYDLFVDPGDSIHEGDVVGFSNFGGVVGQTQSNLLDLHFGSITDYLVPRVAGFPSPCDINGRCSATWELDFQGLFSGFEFSNISQRLATLTVISTVSEEWNESVSFYNDVERGPNEFFNPNTTGPKVAVPEPATMFGLALAGSGLACLRRRRKPALSQEKA